MAGVVERHYDTVAAPPRGRTRIRELRDYHNYVKRRLIAEESGGAAAVVVDVGCGKGGDLPKLDRGALRRYVGLDVSENCLREARSRAAGLLGPGVDATFRRADFRDPPPDLPPGAADLVLCHFVLHYLWGDEPTARRSLGAMSRALRPGGRLLVITGDADVILSRGLRHGSDVYEVAFERAPSESDPFEGTRYAFTLRDGGEAALDACPEHLVHGPTLVRIAADCGLRLRRQLNLTELGAGYRGAVPAEQWQVTALYRAFVFERSTSATTSANPARGS